MISRANRRILFIDMNSFFASVEQAENPALAGKPIIVIPGPGSCALSASYEAKAFGIKTGTLEREARFLCPHLIAVSARPKIYMEYHYRLEELLNNLSPRVTMRSVDEGSILLCRNEEPWALGGAIKQGIWQAMGQGVNCSIGIGPNLLLAKLATNLKKPDGLVEIRLEDLPTIYQKIGLTDLYGINFRMERQLNSRGIVRVTDFYNQSADQLRAWFGVLGYRWWLQLHGYPSYEHQSVRRTISHSHVLPPKLRSPEQAYVTLQRLIAKVSRRLRKNGYLAGRIMLWVRFVDRSDTGLQLRITPAADALTLAEHLNQLWRQLASQTPILKLAVWTTDLVAAVGQPLPLFAADRKRLQLTRALDTINDRYGADTIHFAIIDTKGSRAPDRISFTALFPIEHG